MPQNDKNHQFVSRGGVKLQAAIENWDLKIENCTVLDVGSSTGGFVDCLLQNGAKKVYSVDTSYGELAWRLRNDPRVVVMERTNILHLEKLPPCHSGDPAKTETPESFPQERSWSSQDDNIKVDIVTIDAGWTKLELVLPVVKKFLKAGGVIIALLKPHYEAEKQFKGGVVPEDQVEQIKEETIKKIQSLGFKVEEEMESPILGGAGNREYLLKILPP